MATLLEPIGEDLADLYDGFDEREIGLGLISPSIYASEEYRETKIEHMLIGAISDCIYSGFEHDVQPRVLSLYREARYNTILGLNLNYVPESSRRAILKYVLEDNVNNIRNQLPIRVDWNGLVRAIPETEAITRRYKQVGLRVINTHRIADWPNIIQGRSQWENHYQFYMT